MLGRQISTNDLQCAIAVEPILRRDLIRHLQILIALAAMTLSSYSYAKCGGAVPLLN